MPPEVMVFPSSTICISYPCRLGCRDAAGPKGGQSRISLLSGLRTTLKAARFLRTALILSVLRSMTCATCMVSCLRTGRRMSWKGDIPRSCLIFGTLSDGPASAEGNTGGRVPSCYRIEVEENRWKKGERKEIVTTYSPTREIASVCNHVSHNLYADALVKTVGLQYKPRRKRDDLLVWSWCAGRKNIGRRKVWMSFRSG